MATGGCGREADNDGSSPMQSHLTMSHPEWPEWTMMSCAMCSACQTYTTTRLMQLRLQQRGVAIHRLEHLVQHIASADCALRNGGQANPACLPALEGGADRHRPLRKLVAAKARLQAQPCVSVATG